MRQLSALLLFYLLVVFLHLDAFGCWSIKAYWIC